MNRRTMSRAQGRCHGHIVAPLRSLDTQVESVVAGDLRLEPAVCPVRRDRGGVRPATIDRAPPAAAGDPEAVCGKMSCDRLDPAMSLIPPRCVQVGPPPDAANAATIQWFREPGSKFPST